MSFVYTPRWTDTFSTRPYVPRTIIPKHLTVNGLIRGNRVVLRKKREDEEALQSVPLGSDTEKTLDKLRLLLRITSG